MPKECPPATFSPTYEEIYGLKFSPASVSNSTDSIVTMVRQWQSRPLESIYPIMFLDAIHYKVREDGRVITKAAYTCSGIDINGNRDKKQFMSDLKPVYNAPTEDSALFNLDQLESKWGKKYSVVIKSWRNNWTGLSVFFQYPEDIRRIIYTTNAVESLHSRFRKIINAKTQFPNDESLTKIIYLAYKGIAKKWLPVRNWAYVISQFSVTFEDRISKYL